MIKKLLLATTMALAMVAPTKADVFTLGGIDWTTNASTSNLSLSTTAPPGGQTTNIPCIICGTNQPQQFQDFGYNNYQQGGNITNFNAFSDGTAAHGGVTLANDTQGTPYIDSFLRAFLIANFAANLDLNIGIDVNTATGAGPERLQLFAVLDVQNHNILALYNGGIQGTALPTNNNGTGFPDYFLTGFNLDRSDLQLDSKIEFFARWTNTSDGAESFFLVPVAVPGPVVGAGLPGIIAACVGLWGLALHRRRQRMAA
jgi:hypothetical protein